jgi:glutathione synthase/RimK-type ligase-like ATP-grasp enzyme
MKRSVHDRVLVVSHRDDPHARAVLHALRCISGLDGSGILFDTATFPMASYVSVGSQRRQFLSSYPPLPEMFGGDTRVALRRATTADNTLLSFERLRAIYWRRPRAFLIDDTLTDADLQQYASKNSRETIFGLVERLALNRRVIDVPSRVTRASLKLLQLELAARLKLAVPRTLVSNSPEESKRFISSLWRRGREVISKSPADLHFFSARTEVLDRSTLDRLHEVRLSPTIFQERIVGGPDLRITVVGSRIFGMAQISRPMFAADSRLDPEPRREPFDVPRRLGTRLLRFQRALGLRYGAFDFKCDTRGTPYFLEINPAGQWLAVELAVRHPIAESIARYLWQGRGAEWRTTLPPLTEDDVESLSAFRAADEYANLKHTGKRLHPIRSNRDEPHAPAD